MKTKISVLLLMIIFSLTAIQCSDDDDNIKEDGQLNVKITDAPSDDAKIQGTFVTVSEVKIDGKAVEGFTAQTIEISAYQQGATKLIVDETVVIKIHQACSTNNALFYNERKVERQKASFYHSQNMPVLNPFLGDKNGRYRIFQEIEDRNSRV